MCFLLQLRRLTFTRLGHRLQSGLRGPLDRWAERFDHDWNVGRVNVNQADNEQQQ
jgi:hypothetical protein